MRRREFIVGLSGASLTWSPAVRAQKAGRIRLIGAIPLGPSYAKAFRESLEALGWTDGRNARIEFRYVSGDASSIRADVAELVALAPEVILSAGTETTTALQQASHTIPIVFVHVADPAGMVQSLAQPGGNLTGFTSHESSIGGKWLEILKEIAPRVDEVMVLVDPQNSTWEMHLKTIEAAAPSFGVQVTAKHVRNAVQIRSAIGSLAGKQEVGVIALPSLLVRDEGEQIIALTSKHRVPAICSFRPFVISGLLVSYSADWFDLYRRAASYVDRILKGEKPANLPVQQPIKYELIINLKTAKELDLTVPRTLLARADEVIE